MCLSIVQFLPTGLLWERIVTECHTICNALDSLKHCLSTTTVWSSESHTPGPHSAGQLGRFLNDAVFCRCHIEPHFRKSPLRLPAVRVVRVRMKMLSLTTHRAC